MIEPALHPLRRRVVSAAVLAAAATIVGCARPEGIGKYDVKRDTANTPGVTGPIRLLGAIIPAGKDSSWFVKFVGPIEQITAQEKAFDEFVNSIRLPADGKAPTYTPPANWKDGGNRPMRIVTFIPPGEGKQPELYISQPFQGTLLMNVNRWLDEVGKPRVSEAELPTVATELKLDSTKAYKVDLKGPGGKKMPPFAGG